MEIQTAFAKTLLKYRKEAGLSHEKLAVKYGVSRTNISFYEQANRQPSVHSMCLLCDALEISPEEFLNQMRKASPKTFKPKN